MRIPIVILLLAACTATTPATTTTAPATTPPATTPPPPIRTENIGVAFGVVTDANGLPVHAARVTAWPADPTCRAIGNPVTVTTGQGGTYEVELVQGVGPQMAGCVSLHAESGGAVVRAQQPITFANPGNRVRADMKLPRAPELDEQEAHRLTGVFTLAMRQEQEAVHEIALYVDGGIDAARALANEYAQYLRGAESFKLVERNDQSFMYELTGAQSRTRRLVVTRDALIRIRQP